MRNQTVNDDIMHCSNCNKHYPDNAGVRFCDQCGGQIVADAPASATAPVAGSGVQIGNDNVIKELQLHDSHNVDNSVRTTDNSIHNENITNNTTVNNNYTTIHEREKSAEELQQAAEADFISAVERLCRGGIIDQVAYAELNILSQKKNIAPERANVLIDSVRKNVAQKSAGVANDFLAEKTIKEIMAAVVCCNVEVLQQKLPALQQLAKNSTDNNVQFFSNMLNASFNPLSCTVELMNTHTDNYWQIYWTAIAYIKTGKTDKSAELFARLGNFGFPQGDVLLIMALNNIAEYRMNPVQTFYIQQAKENIEEANLYGISGQLIPVWLAANQITSETPSVEDKFRFYYSFTLRELCTTVAPAMPKEAQMAGAGAPPPPPPSAKSADAPMGQRAAAQKVNLSQMQGFNPLEAMEQLNKAAMQQPMGMPQMPGVPPMGAMQMPGVPPMGAPQMPGVPPMGTMQMPGVPPMGAPQMPGTLPPSTPGFPPTPPTEQ